MDLRTVIITTLKAKISPIIAKVKKWLSPSYLKNQAMVKVGEGLKKLFDIRPHDDQDYYSVLHWMVSKKLALAIVTITVLLCGCYFMAMLPKRNTADSGTTVKTYQYNAVPLKFTSGKVRILGKSGYQAYVGEVAKGSVTGAGSLYYKNGDVAYTGEFDHNQYNGTGQLYFANNVLRYKGDFLNNKFQGEGTLFRQDGTKEYEGNFSQDYKDGEGMLYDNSENLVYTGIFRKDSIVYQELMNKTTAEAAAMYTGKKNVYDSESVFCVSMPDIQAVYCGVSGEGTLADEWTIKGVYVLNSEMIIAGEQVSDIGQVAVRLGQPIYEGNTAVSLEDAIAINEASKDRQVLQGKVMMKTTPVLADVVQVEAYDNSYLAYLYMFKKEGYTYTFFCREKDAAFAFYLIEEE